MPFTLVNNGDSGLSARTKINTGLSFLTLREDDINNIIRKDGTTQLTGDWNVGAVNFNDVSNIPSQNITSRLMYDIDGFPSIDWSARKLYGSSVISLDWENRTLYNNSGNPIFSWGAGLVFSGFTEGSVLFIGPSAVVTQNNSNFFWDNTNNRLGIGTSSPTAVLHLKAGTATADTAPLKFTSGTINTTAVAAQYEYNGNHRITNVSLLRMPLGGILFDFFTDTTVGGAEADIYTSTLLANTFNTNGDKVIASYGGNFVTGGTELTQLQVYLAGASIWDSTGLAPATGTTSWRVYVELVRVSSTVVRYTVSLNTTGASGYVYAKSGELTGLTLSSTNILKITGTSTGVGSGSGDIIGRMGYVEFKPSN